MSVAVVITYRQGLASPRPEYLPVATEAIFSRHWVPAAETLGCVWTPLFQTGVPVPLEDFPHVLDELRRLRDHFEADQSSDPGIRERSAWLVAELEKIDPATIEELWIG